ncbi:hypothetical protein LOK49_LG13G01531 [Camellia lanceoleosa]|uniref:Uncharacterized protein n=1 Tax=Camellia lanceoleosa TaxID=1840588 RepID=A0ACC0FN25_9ERIC|nr:hypothetical protein LOK49_LG13G01531 [Camellia lanceoleosa]
MILFQKMIQMSTIVTLARKKEIQSFQFIIVPKGEFVAHIELKALPDEESNVAQQIQEAEFILSDSRASEDWEEEDDADQESDATDYSHAALDNEIEELTAN